MKIFDLCFWTEHTRIQKATIPKKYVCIDYRYVGHLIEEIIREAHTLPLLVFFYLKIHSMTFTIFKERDKNKNRKMQA